MIDELQIERKSQIMKHIMKSPQTKNTINTSSFRKSFPIGLSKLLIVLVFSVTVCMMFA